MGHYCRYTELQFQELWLILALLGYTWKLYTNSKLDVTIHTFPFRIMDFSANWGQWVYYNYILCACTMYNHKWKLDIGKFASMYRMNIYYYKKEDFVLKIFRHRPYILYNDYTLPVLRLLYWAPNGVQLCRTGPGGREEFPPGPLV